MTLTNLCSCALMKDHKIRQIIHECGIIFFKNKYFDLFFFKNLRLYPSSPPPPLLVSMINWWGVFWQAEKGGLRCGHSTKKGGAGQVKNGGS